MENVVRLSQAEYIRTCVQACRLRRFSDTVFVDLETGEFDAFPLPGYTDMIPLGSVDWRDFCDPDADDAEEQLLDAVGYDGFEDLSDAIYAYLKLSDKHDIYSDVEIEWVE